MVAPPNAYKLAKAGLNVLHLPKTIDNDIVGTDDSFGFSTALEIATEAIDRLHSTAHSHHRIILAEIMGHRAGWLALGSGIAGGADVILLPEVPYKLDSIVQAVENRQKQGLNFSVIAVAEGARDEADSAAMAGAQALVDASKTPETKAAAKKAKKDLEHSMRDNTLKLATQLEEATGLESRVSILGYVQRVVSRAPTTVCSRPGWEPWVPSSLTTVSSASWSPLRAETPRPLR